MIDGGSEKMRDDRMKQRVMSDIRQRRRDAFALTTTRKGRDMCGAVELPCGGDKWSERETFDRRTLMSHGVVQELRQDRHGGSFYTSEPEKPAFGGGVNHWF